MEKRFVKQEEVSEVGRRKASRTDGKGRIEEKRKGSEGVCTGNEDTSTDF